jgi:thiol-disulfide isomerase/thioredoxin
VNILFILLMGVLTLLVSVQVFALLKARSLRGKPVAGLTGSLGQAVAAGKKVMAYCYSETCAACRVQTPVMDKLQRELPDIYQIDVANDRENARALGVMGTPATVIIVGGIVKEYLLGAKTEAELRRLFR